MSLAHRIIPCLDTDGSRVVKGVHFEGLRDAGDPVELAARYNAEGADELVVLDIAAARDNRPTFLETIRSVAEQLEHPTLRRRRHSFAGRRTLRSASRGGQGHAKHRRGRTARADQRSFARIWRAGSGSGHRRQTRRERNVAGACARGTYAPQHGTRWIGR